MGGRSEVKSCPDMLPIVLSFAALVLPILVFVLHVLPEH